MIDIEKYFENFYRGNKNPSLNSMKYFLNEYGNFQDEMKFIHIAGTNGKGSCVEMISNILSCEGYKVGKFLSPHLIKYNERISINGKLITDLEMSNLIEELEPKIEEYNKSHEALSLFELESLMAFIYFYRNKVDFVVLETGLGGLFDGTNIIKSPLVSVITSIGFDHMHILGNTLPEIASQKAGIIKENSNTVFFKQSQDVNDVFINTCIQKNNKLHLVSEEDISNYSYDNELQYFDFKNIKQIELILKGKKQIQNASICIECINILNELGYKVSEDSIKKGLKTVVHKARMETINKNPLIIFDGAHNEPAIQNLQDMISMYYKNIKRTYIISILKRKDYEKMIKLLLNDENADFIFTSGNDDQRYASSKDLYDIAVKYKNNQNLYQMSLENAIKYVVQSQNQDVNFVVRKFLCIWYSFRYIK